jgi:hypothetical protein
VLLVPRQDGLFNGMMIKVLRSSGSRRTCGAVLLVFLIGAWLPSYSLRASRIFAFVRESRAAEEPASLTQRIDLIQRIDQEVHQIRSGADAGKHILQS